jgi:membrane-associated protease RseP (regulator of RpoE activity)
MRLTVLATVFALALPSLAQEIPAPTGYLGVSVAPLDEETRQAHRIGPEIETGVVLAQVLEKSPAARAGLRPGDVVTSFDKQVIRTPQDLVRAVQMHRPGDKVEYVVLRGPGTIAGILTLGKREGIESSEVEVEIVPPEGEVEGRVEELQQRVVELRRRFVEARERIEKMRRPKSLEGWIHREQRAVQEAEARGDTKAMHYHANRLSVLREMRDSGMELAERRLESIEKKVDEILELLRR